MKDKLKFCPFCGGAPTMRHTQFGMEGVPRYGVACPVCAICIGWYFEPDEAVKRWNTRPRGSDKREHKE